VVTAQLVSLEEYLHTTYRPDREYLDGELRERNVGQFDDSNLQAILTAIFFNNRGAWGVRGLPEQRLRVTPTRYRIPDVLAIPLDYRSPIIEQAPLLCIEILSPDDTRSDLVARGADYLSLGVPETWIFDPAKRKAYVYSSRGLHEIEATATLRCGKIEISVADLFRQLAD
jgi:Uma2 family endonuclease